MSDLMSMERTIIDFMEALEENGTDAANIYEKATEKAAEICQQGTPEMKALMVMVENWISEKF